MNADKVLQEVKDWHDKFSIVEPAKQFFTGLKNIFFLSNVAQRYEKSMPFLEKMGGPVPNNKDYINPYGNFFSGLSDFVMGEVGIDSAAQALGWTHNSAGTMLTTAVKTAASKGLLALSATQMVMLSSVAVTAAAFGAGYWLLNDMKKKSDKTLEKINHGLLKALNSVSSSTFSIVGKSNQFNMEERLPASLEGVTKKSDRVAILTTLMDHNRYVLARFNEQGRPEAINITHEQVKNALSVNENDICDLLKHLSNEVIKEHGNNSLYEAAQKIMDKMNDPGKIRNIHAVALTDKSLPDDAIILSQRAMKRLEENQEELGNLIRISLDGVPDMLVTQHEVDAAYSVAVSPSSAITVPSIESVEDLNSTAWLEFRLKVDGDDFNCKADKGYAVLESHHEHGHEHGASKETYEHLMAF